MEFLQMMDKTVQDYYTAMKTLEEFGPDSNKTSPTVVGEESSRAQEEAKAGGDNVGTEGIEEANENTQDYQSNQNNGSQRLGE